MANAQAIINKIVRNMEQRGYYNPGNSTLTNHASPVQIVEVGATAKLTQANGHVITVSYVVKNTQSPMGGVDGTISPFLGIGIAAPGTLQMQGASGDTTVAAIMTDSAALELWYELAGYDNSLVLMSGDGTTVLATVRGSESVLGLGS